MQTDAPKTAHGPYTAPRICPQVGPALPYLPEKRPAQDQGDHRVEGDPPQEHVALPPVIHRVAPFVRRLPSGSPAAVTSKGQQQGNYTMDFRWRTGSLPQFRVKFLLA